MSTTIFLLVLCSAATHASWNFAARKVSGDFGVVWLALVIVSFLALPFAVAAADAPTRRAVPFMLATAAINAVYFLALAKAYQLGGLTQVYPVARGSGVVGAAVASEVLLRERLGAFGALGVGFVCAGLWLLRRRAAAHERPGWLPYALIAGASICASAVIDKTAMSRMASPFVYIVGLFAGSALFLAPYALSRRRADILEAARRRKRLAAFIGCASMASYLLVLVAFRRGPLGPIAAVRESSVVFGALLGVAFLGEPLTRSRAAGIAAVAAGLGLLRLV